MKTAISIPDDVFEQAEALAKRLNISRSELYSRAVRDYVRSRDRTEITRALNESIGDEDTSLDPVFRELSRRTLLRQEW